MNHHNIKNIDPQLSETHRQILEDKYGISSEVIAARGYRTITDPKELKPLGFSPAQCRVPGLLIPLHTTDGQSGLDIYRPDTPRVFDARGNGKHARSKILEYEIPKGKVTRLDCPPNCSPMLANPNICLWITESQMKADTLASKGLCTIALPCAWSYAGINDSEGLAFSPDWVNVVLNNNRIVRIIMDVDEQICPETHTAFRRLSEQLIRKGAKAETVHLLQGNSMEYIGVNDWFALGHTIAEFEVMSSNSPDASVFEPPKYTILAGNSPVMMRPLSLINGKAYAASWQTVEISVSDEIEEDGKRIHHDPPVICREKRLIVLDEDGNEFGGSRPLTELGFEYRLKEELPPESKWSGSGMNSYLKGERPSPKDVFERMIRIVDKFIDFNKSNADQRTMCEFIACYAMSTWFLDAFNVIGYLWFTGAYGSGKTNLLILIAELSYIGQLISHSGTFPTLRDMADYGATLACDDVENIIDPKKTDPDKRALLLAGNRRGVTVTLKELGPDQQWHTRHVNAFCPRSFSAIGTPDLTFASRMIIVPLVRTSDKKRANIDPKDYALWPCDRQKLHEDLWALGLSNLSKLVQWDKWVGENSPLNGRNLQPLRAILAVAKWLDVSDIPGLYQRIESLSIAYQSQREELETADMTRLVLESLGECASCASSASSASNYVNNRKFVVPITEVTRVAEKLAEEQDMDINKSLICKAVVGRKLGSLRFEKAPRPGGRGSRLWLIDLDHLVQIAGSYNVNLPKTITDMDANKSACSPKTSGTCGTSGTAGSEASQSNSFFSDLNPSTKPENPCYSCGSMDFWQRSDGGWVCNICHPQS